MPIDDFLDPNQPMRKSAKAQERSAVHQSSGLRAQYITRTDFDALILDGSTNPDVLYAVDEAL